MAKEKHSVRQRPYEITRRFVPSEVNILLHDFRDLEQWAHSSLAHPFWRLYWNDRDGAAIRFQDIIYRLSPQALYLIPPHTNFSAMLEKAHVRQFYIHFTLGRNFENVRPQIFSMPLDRRRRKLIGLIIQTANASDFNNPFCSLLLLALIHDALCSLPADIWSRKVLDPRVEKAIDLMLDSGFAASLDNATLAEAAAMSTNAFIRLFIQEIGSAPMHFYMQKRLEHAAILLRHSQHSIKEVADECGFCDRHHFTKAFRRRYGMGPAAYNRQRQV